MSKMIDLTGQRLIFDVANFPVSGPKRNPTRDDYAAEAMILRQEAELIQHRIGSADTYRHLMEASRRFRDIAERLDWVPRRGDAEHAA